MFKYTFDVDGGFMATSEYTQNQFGEWLFTVWGALWKYGSLICRDEV